MSGPESAENGGFSRRRLLVTTSGITIGGVVSNRQVVASSSEQSRWGVLVSQDETLPSDPFDRAREETDVTVTTTDHDVVQGIKQLVSGKADVVHTRRPILPKEAKAIEDRGDVGFESIAGTAFIQETETWRSPLHEDERLTLREANPRAGTWAEVADRDEVVMAEFEESALDDPPQSGGEAIARGVRSGQYATGHGGLGYYRLAADDIVSAEIPGEGEVLTPIVQLQYTYVNGESRGREGVEQYLTSLEIPAGHSRSLEPFPVPGERVGLIEPIY